MGQLGSIDSAACVRDADAAWEATSGALAVALRRLRAASGLVRGFRPAARDHRHIPVQRRQRSSQQGKAAAITSDGVLPRRERSVSARPRSQMAPATT